MIQSIKFFECLIHNTCYIANTVGFPGSSAGKESTCNTGDPGLIPGSERPSGEGLGYPLQYSWASLVTQSIKNLPAMLETWVWSLGSEDALEKGKVAHYSILTWRIPWTEEPDRLESMGSQRVGHNWGLGPQFPKKCLDLIPFWGN